MNVHCSSRRVLARRIRHTPMSRPPIAWVGRELNEGRRQVTDCRWIWKGEDQRRMGSRRFMFGVVGGTHREWGGGAGGSLEDVGANVQKHYHQQTSPPVAAVPFLRRLAAQHHRVGLHTKQSVSHHRVRSIDHERQAGHMKHGENGPGHQLQVKRTSYNCRLHMK